MPIATIDLRIIIAAAIIDLDELRIPRNAIATGVEVTFEIMIVTAVTTM
jgi:hypothetical protein